VKIGHIHQLFDKNPRPGNHKKHYNPRHKLYSLVGGTLQWYQRMLLCSCEVLKGNIDNRYIRKMTNQLEQHVFEVGMSLQSLPHFKNTLLKILKQAAEILSKVGQSPSQVMLDAIHPLREALVMTKLLRHRDGEVSLRVAICISEITRITAPNAPYKDEVLRDTFQLIVTTFRGLDDIASPLFGERVTILETMAKIESCFDARNWVCVQ
jgi:hypothetical protein